MTVTGARHGVPAPACVPIARTWPAPGAPSQELSLPAASQEQLTHALSRLCLQGLSPLDSK